jgi:hypothetical protein
MNAMKHIRVIMLAAALVLGAGGAAVAASSSHASGMTEICDSIEGGYCPNAWGGGPSVKMFTSGVQNDWFQVNSLGGGLYDIEDMNTGTYIGDAGNNQYSAQAGLVLYGGWGYRFQELGCEGITGGVTFENIHWNDRLSGGDSDGSQVYLNTNSNQCFLQKPF